MQRSPSSSVFKSKLTDRSTEIDKMIFLTRANSVGKIIMKQLNAKWKGQFFARLITNKFLFYFWASTMEMYSNYLELVVIKTVGQIHFTRIPLT